MARITLLMMLGLYYTFSKIVSRLTFCNSLQLSTVFTLDFVRQSKFDGFLWYRDITPVHRLCTGNKPLPVSKMPQSTDVYTLKIKELSRCQLYQLEWHHNGRDCVSNHQRLERLFNRLFRHRSKKTSKLRVTGLCEGNSPVTGNFRSQRASNAENVSIWWRHHGHWGHHIYCAASVYVSPGWRGGEGCFQRVPSKFHSKTTKAQCDTVMVCFPKHPIALYSMEVYDIMIYHPELQHHPTYNICCITPILASDVPDGMSSNSTHLKK